MTIMNSCFSSLILPLNLCIQEGERGVAASATISPVTVDGVTQRTCVSSFSAFFVTKLSGFGRIGKTLPRTHSVCDCACMHGDCFLWIPPPPLHVLFFYIIFFCLFFIIYTRFFLHDF